MHPERSPGAGTTTAAAPSRAVTDLRELRNAFGTFATGVTIVTTVDAAKRPVGLTANSFSSVSLEPPLVLWSLARTSPNLAVFEAASHFAVNVLAREHAALSRRFASPVPDKFAAADWREGLGGVPLLVSAAAHLECATVQRIDGGDHVIFLGRVERFSYARAEPLVFCHGRFMTAAAIQGEPC